MELRHRPGRNGVSESRKPYAVLSKRERPARQAVFFKRVSAYYIGRGMGWIALRQVADRSVAGKLKVRGSVRDRQCQRRKRRKRRGEDPVFRIETKN
jgi:hypothetical protein